MATRLYLRDTVVASGAPPAGERSAALPVGITNGPSSTNDEKLSLLTTKGTTEANRQVTQLTQDVHQDNYLARFVSESFAVQTIAANTWSFGLSCNGDSGLANSFFAISLYVYRPSTDTVVGYIYDADTALGAEWSSGKDGKTFTVSGSAITASMARPMSPRTVTRVPPATSRRRRI
jgi:hypothetical protein